MTAQGLQFPPAQPADRGEGLGSRSEVDRFRVEAGHRFRSIEAEIRSGTYLLYDCACGTGGMLTVAEETLTSIGGKRGQRQ